MWSSNSGGGVRLRSVDVECGAYAMSAQGNCTKQGITAEFPQSVFSGPINFAVERLFMAVCVHPAKNCLSV